MNKGCPNLEKLDIIFEDFDGSDEKYKPEDDEKNTFEPESKPSKKDDQKIFY